MVTSDSKDDDPAERTQEKTATPTRVDYQPRSTTRLFTRSRMSSRIRRTVSMSLPLGSCSGQSSRSSPGTTGHASPQPIVTSRFAPAARSRVRSTGLASERSIPTSFIAARTSGWTREPGSVPAEIPLARSEFASLFIQAAAICDRLSLCMQGNRMVFIFLFLMGNEHAGRDAWQTGNEPPEKGRGCSCAEELRHDETRGVRRTYAGEGVAGSASEGDRRVRKRGRRGEPVGRGDVGAHGERGRRRSRPAAPPDDREQSERRDEFAHDLSHSAPHVVRRRKQRL